MELISASMITYLSGWATPTTEKLLTKLELKGYVEQIMDTQSILGGDHVIQVIIDMHGLRCPVVIDTRNLEMAKNKAKLVWDVLFKNH